MRLPVSTSLKIDDFASGSVVDKDSYTKNLVFGKRPNGNLYVTQRPGVNISQDASATVSDARGRGVYYWNAVSALYFVNNDTVYKSTYSAPLAATMTAGTERVEILECGSYLVIIDAENNEGWVINSASSTTLTAISDVDFPPNNSMTLARGAVSKNGIIYVLTTDGDIYESDVEDPTSWNPLSFRNAESKPDDGVYITDHHGEVVVFGTRSTEFFTPASVTSGSTLTPRTDMDYSIGSVDHATESSVIDIMFFVGLAESGDIGVYTMTNYSISKISANDMDTFLQSAVNSDDIKLFGSATSVGGRIFYMLTTYRLSADATPVVEPIETFVFTSDLQHWGFWELSHTGIDDCPLIEWTSSTTTRNGEGMLTNGDLIDFQDDFNAQDTVGASAWVADGWVNDGWASKVGATGTDIECEQVFGRIDLETTGRKYAGDLRVFSRKTSSSLPVTIKTQDNGGSWSSGRTVDINNPANRLNRMGSYYTRNHMMQFTASEQVEIEGLDI